MKFSLLFLMLVLCGCSGSQEAGVSFEKRQAAIAKEIVSIEYAAGNALLQLNDTNAVNYAAEVNTLSDRLDKISIELDTLGPFSAGLREATLKKLDEVEKDLSPRLQIKIKSISPQPEVGEIIAPAVARYLSAGTSVKDKAGLLIEAKGKASGVNTNTNHP